MLKSIIQAGGAVDHEDGVLLVPVRLSEVLSLVAMLNPEQRHTVEPSDEMRVRWVLERIEKLHRECVEARAEAAGL